MTSAERLLTAEKQFSELAEQLQKLKTAAQAIEQAGHATGQMRALAESAIATAASLGEKISHTTEFLEKQNIPERLLENESRLNAKFLELKEQGGQASGQIRALAETTVANASSLGDKISQTTKVIEKQNIPERLLENESRLNAKFLELKELESASISAAERDAQSQRALLIELKGSVTALETRFAQESEKTSKTFRRLLLVQVLLSALLAYLILKF